MEERVDEFLFSRLQDICTLFGQLPDVLEAAWVAVALGDKEQAVKIIDAAPEQHPSELRYTKVKAIGWESCRQTPDAQKKRRMFSKGW